MRTGLPSFSGLVICSVAAKGRSSTRRHSMPKRVPTGALPSQPLGRARVPPTVVVMRAYPCTSQEALRNLTLCTTFNALLMRWQATARLLVRWLLMPGVPCKTRFLARKTQCKFRANRTWKWPLMLTEKMRNTLAVERKASLSLASLWRCVAHTPSATARWMFSWLMLFRMKYLLMPPGPGEPCTMLRRANYLAQV